MGAISSARRAAPPSPTGRQIGSHSRFVSSSIRSRASTPAGVIAPAASTHPRSPSPATAVAHCCSSHCRVALARPSGNRPVPTCRTRHSDGPIPLASSSATWTSPRHSRITVSCCQSATSGSSGRLTPALAAASGFPARSSSAMTGSTIERASSISAADSEAPTRSSDRRTTRKRAACNDSGDAFSQAPGMADITAVGLKL